MIGASELVSRLAWSKSTGRGKWIARCPSHEDRGPSLSIRELEDGRTLLHCFAGCEVESVVGAVGLTMADLFPPRRDHDYQPQARRSFDAFDVLCCLAHEASIVLVAARDLITGHPVIGDDLERLSLAYRRINVAVGVIHA